MKIIVYYDCLCYIKKVGIVPSKLKDQLKYDELLPKLSDKLPCNKLCVDLIGIYMIHMKGKLDLTLNHFIIDTIMGWFETTY